MLLDPADILRVPHRDIWCRPLRYDGGDHMAKLADEESEIDWTVCIDCVIDGVGTAEWVDSAWVFSTGLSVQDLAYVMLAGPPDTVVQV